MKFSKLILLAITFSLALGFAALDASVAQAEETTQSKAQNQVIVVHLSKFTNDLHAAFMAIKLAGVMQAKGAAVTLFLDLEGVRAVDTRQPQDLTWGLGHAASFAELYEAFIKAGGRALVCPHCAKAVGMTEQSLRPGAKIGGEEEIAGLLLSAGKVLDY